MFLGNLCRRRVSGSGLFLYLTSFVAVEARESIHFLRGDSPLQISHIDDHEGLFNYLLQDRIGSAYQLGYLDPVYGEYCQWYGVTSDEGALEAVLLVYSGLSVPAVLAFGPDRGLDALLRSVAAQLPDRFYVHIASTQLSLLSSKFAVSGLKKMVRMAILRQNYKPLPKTAEVVRIGHQDTGELLMLYRQYPDNLFEPYQLESGYYFGIRQDGKLVSVAGVHALSPKYGVAAIGNIVTDARFRGQGLSTQCTSALVEALFEVVPLVTLNVEDTNPAAHRTFEKLGFVDHSLFYQGIVNRSG